MSTSPQHPRETRYSGVIHTLTAAEASTLETREINGQTVRDVPAKLGRQFRRVERAAYDKDARTVTVAASSSTPVDRYYGQEILSHAKGALRTGRLDNGVSLLFNHDYDALLGRSVGYEVGDPLRVTSRFGTSALAQEKERDVEAEILVDVSIGYLVHEWEIVEDKNGNRTYTAVDWELLEVSLVTVPADPTVGVGRDAKDAVPVKVRSFRKADEDDAPDDDDEEEDSDDAEERTAEDERALASGGNAGEATNETVIGEPKDDDTERSAAQPTQQRTIVMAEENKDLATLNQERITGLRQLHKDYPKEFTERSLKAAESLDVPVETVKARIADQIIKQSERSNVATLGDEISDEMSEREVKTYSLRNAYAFAVNQVKPGTFRDKGADAGFEREISQTLQKRAEERGVSGIGGNIVIPGATSRLFQRQAQQRALASGGNAGTATNVIDVQADPIELLRFRTSVLAMGARMMTGLFGEIKMPRQTAAGQSNWLAEGGQATETDPTLDAITMSPSRLSMWNAYYRELLLQSALSVDSFLAADRMNVLSRSLDTVCLAGSGAAPVPLGLLNQSGLPAILAGTTRAANGTVTAGAGGVPLTFVDYNNMEAAIATANGDIGTMGIITTPRVRAAGRSTPQIPGTASGFVWPNSKVGANGVQEGPLGYNAIATSNPVLTGFTANSVNGLHAAIMGVWDQMLIGDWGFSEVIVDPYTGASEALYNITEHAFYGTNIRHLPCFCACTSVLPS